jgi:hypothetical protein
MRSDQFNNVSDMIFTFEEMNKSVDFEYIGYWIFSFFNLVVII